MPLLPLGQLESSDLRTVAREIGFGGFQQEMVVVAHQNVAMHNPATALAGLPERLQKYRRNILEMLFAERNHICSVCVSNGHCEMQTLAQKLELTHVHFPYRYPKLDVDATHERFSVDHNRCILCTRCVRFMSDVDGDALTDNAIEIYVHRLRKRIEPYDAVIRTVRGLGYLLDKSADE